MLRKGAVLLVIAVAAGLTAFWVITIPGTVPVSLLVPHTPNLEARGCQPPMICRNWGIPRT